MLRLFEENDLNETVNMFYNIFTKAPWHLTWLTIKKVEEYFIDMLDTPKSKTFCYIDENKIVGVCFGAVNFCAPLPLYEIKEIFVKQNLQNKGIGTAMLKQIEMDLKKNNIDGIRLFTVRIIPAYDFYIKNGYIENRDAASLSKMF